MGVIGRNQITSYGDFFSLPGNEELRLLFNGERKVIAFFSLFRRLDFDDVAVLLIFATLFFSKRKRAAEG